jgi:hypothetical protein
MRTALREELSDLVKLFGPRPKLNLNLPVLKARPKPKEATVQKVESKVERFSNLSDEELLAQYGIAPLPKKAIQEPVEDPTPLFAVFERPQRGFE